MSLKLKAAVCALIVLGIAFWLKPPSHQGKPVIQARLANPPEGILKTVKGDDGDVIDCVDIYKQPAFDYPLLKDHTLQIKPSSYPNGIQPNVAFVPESLNKNNKCPDGSVPIRRQIDTGIPVIRRQCDSTVMSCANSNDHQYAFTAYRTSAATMKGAHAAINIWKPQLAKYTDFTLSQIWVIAGKGDDLNTIEAGWHVYPGLNGDAKPRLFIYWTRDNYRTTGCYNFRCPGFVLTNPNNPIGGALTTSVYNYKQQEIDLMIYKDDGTKAWWLYVNGQKIGYWPEDIFTALQKGSDAVHWGGEIYDTTGTGGLHSLTQMGSGHHAKEGYRKASYVNGLYYYDSSGVAVNLKLKDLTATAGAPACYSYKYQASGNDLYFFYGGPGCR
ncbi:hypothetical protein Nepgr_017845 [Nepenthes gracilis]|uniref:Neprosin PEP catalytic domain-containing protein n=1 Tax=Nepenthes gracilis TaxID=150966 RepID=A0AAD3XTI0_NEPGR|nr:hypothetical protein Nepgr_017845 [Nepenthes gracilis]